MLQGIPAARGNAPERKESCDFHHNSLRQKADQLVHVLVNICGIFRDAFVMLIVEAFTLDDPECLEILLVKGILDLLPVHVALGSTHLALDREAFRLLGIVHAGLEALKDLHALFQRQLFDIAKRASAAFLLMTAGGTRAGSLNLAVLFDMDRDKAVQILTNEARRIAVFMKKTEKSNI